MKRASFRNLLILGVFFAFCLCTSTIFAARTIVVPDDYANIQIAIWNADPGDEIFIKAGRYIPHFFVDQKVTIRGEVSPSGKLLTVLDGAYKYTVLTLLEDECTIKDLIIQNSSPDPGHAGILVLSDENTIENCIIRNSYDGIRKKTVKHNKVDSCVFYNNSNTDIRMEFVADSNVIQNNEFQSGPLGIHIEECEKNRIKANLFSTVDGLELTRSIDTDINANDFVCDNLNAQDDTGMNNWKHNGYSDYDAYSGPHPIPGGGHAEDHEAFIALSRYHREYPGAPDIIVPDDYPTIQEAVNQGDNNVVFVRAGVYDEINIHVTTSNNTIIGEVDKNGQLLTVLDAQRAGCGFQLWKPETTVANLVIENTSNGWPDNSGVWIHSESKNNTIVNCVFRRVRNAIFFDPGTDNSGMLIEDNRIYGYSYAGITLDSGWKYIIINNQFHMNSKRGAAIELRNNVTESLIEMNMISTGDGIEVFDSDRVLIQSNELTCDDRNAVDPTGLNRWQHNGYSDFEYPFHVYNIHPGITIDNRAHLAHSMMY